MKNTLYIIFVCFLASCSNKPAVLFDQPQPPNGNNLKEIPRRLRGEYQNRNDSSLLIINKNVIYKTLDLEIRLKNNKPDSGYELHGDTLINLKFKEKISVIRLNDSTLIHKYADTVFSISGRNVFRRFKGYYFLNTPYESEWEVQKISLHKGVLTLSKISAKEEIDNLNEIKDDMSDTLIHHVAPTRKQFRKFVKNDGFSNGEEYVKVK